MKLQNGLFIVFIALLSSSSLLAKEKSTEEDKGQITPIVDPNRMIPGIVNVHSLGIGLGETFLKGDFKEHGDDRISGDLFYSYSASYSFDLIANGHYSEHKYKQEWVKLQSVNFAIKGKFFQYDSFAPYVMGGLGFYYPTVKREIDSIPTESKGKLVFGTNLGLGVDLRLNRHWIVGALAHYHNPFTVKQDSGPDVEGYYTKLMMILMYTF